ncbi:MAG: hypothetical protein AAF560_25800 [Acidobacteriota bacterium]
MNEALASDELEMIGIARPLCLDPALSKGLLDGSVESAPLWERGLRLGPGAFGPSSGVKMMRGFNHQAAVAWYYRHILALADDRPIDTGLSARKALFQHLRDEARLARARRRYRKA